VPVASIMRLCQAPRIVPVSQRCLSYVAFENGGLSRIGLRINLNACISMGRRTSDAARCPINHTVHRIIRPRVPQLHGEGKVHMIKH
jgi:hypothetical protein